MRFMTLRCWVVLSVIGWACHAIAAGCADVPAIPPVPSGAKSAADFGAKPDDDVDDTAALQKALDGLRGGEALVLPPGQYLQGDVLRLRVPNTALFGSGATLLATNPMKQAVMLAADGTALYGLRLTAVTDRRQSKPETARVAVYKTDGNGKPQPVARTVIQGIDVANGGEPGSAQANGASSAGIFVYKAVNFVVADNKVSRTLADGIHVTGGSSGGIVTRNVVRQTGDDMIAVVSYGGGASSLTTNVLIAGNDVADNYWGRGITVVGGASITIADNHIAGVAGGAGVLLAREHSYKTMGVRDVLVERNTIERIQSSPPPYNPGNKFKGRSTQAAIEVQSFMFDDEHADDDRRNALSVSDIAIRDNIIRDSGTGAVRMGLVLNGGGAAKAAAAVLGSPRRASSGLVRNVAVEGNQLSGVSYGVQVLGSADQDSISCSGNRGPTGDNLDGCVRQSTAKVEGSRVCATDLMKR